MLKFKLALLALALTACTGGAPEQGSITQTVGIVRLKDDRGRRCNNIPVYDIQREELAFAGLTIDAAMIESENAVSGCLHRTLSFSTDAVERWFTDLGHATVWQEFSRFPSGRSLNSLNIHWFTSRNGAWDNLLESSGIDGSPHSQFTETVENWGEINVIMRQVPQERTYSLYALVNQPAQGRWLTLRLFGARSSEEALQVARHRLGILKPLPV